ncbi:hypothetical protein BVX95_02190, partial [archaeon D22]
VDTPTFLDYVPRFQTEMIRGLQGFLKKSSEGSQSAKRIEALDLTSLINVESRILDFDSVIIRDIKQVLEKYVSWTWALGEHVKGSTARATQPEKSFGQLTFLDDSLKERYFEKVNEGEFNGVLKGYEAALYVRLGFKNNGVDRKDVDVESKHVSKEDKLLIEDICDDILGFNIDVSSPSKRIASVSNKGVEEMQENQNPDAIKSLPYFMSISERAKEYHIARQVLNMAYRAMEMDDAIDLNIEGRASEPDQFCMKVKQGDYSKVQEIDSYFGMGGSLLKIAELYVEQSKLLPEGMDEYLDNKASLFFHSLNKRKVISCSKSEISDKRARNRMKKSVEAYESRLKEFGINPVESAFMEELTSLKLCGHDEAVAIFSDVERDDEKYVSQNEITSFLRRANAGILNETLFHFMYLIFK